MQYTGKEFADLKTKKEPATWSGAVFAVLVFGFLFNQGAKPYSFLTLTDRGAWVWEVTVMGYMLKVSQDVREQVQNFYWAKSMVTTAIAAFGGGFLAPMIVGHCPIPLREETFAWFVVFSWYITHYVPFVSAKWGEIAKSKAGWATLTILFGVFKTQQIVGAVELALKAIPREPLEAHSRYFDTPIAGPIVCGFLGGCGGAFLPFEKGLRPLEEGKQWPISAALFATVIYYFSTRCAGVDQTDAKLVICLLRILGDLFPETRTKIMGWVSSVLYVGLHIKLSEDSQV